MGVIIGDILGYIYTAELLRQVLTSTFPTFFQSDPLSYVALNQTYLMFFKVILVWMGIPHAAIKGSIKGQKSELYFFFIFTDYYMIKIRLDCIKFHLIASAFKF